MRHWADGGETSIENIVSLCREHHGRVHEGGFGIEMVDGRAVITDPAGRVVPAVGAMPVLEGDAVMSLAATHNALGLHIDASTGSPRWRGESMDYDWAVAALL